MAEWSHLLVDPVRQLRALADLFEDGLLSRVEYERLQAPRSGAVITAA